MAWVDEKLSNGSSANSPSFGTLPVNAPSGTLVIVCNLFVPNGSARTGGVPTSSHGTWVDSGEGSVESASSTSNHVESFYCLNPSTGSNYSLTIPNSGGTTVFYIITCYSESGSSVYLDGAASATGTTADPSGSVTTGNDNSLVVGALVTDALNLAGLSSGTNYTEEAKTDMGQACLSVEYDLDAGTAGSITVDWSDGADEWAIIMMGFSTSAGTSQVYKDLAVQYDIAELVNKDLAVQYDMLELVSKDIGVLYDIRNLASKDLQLLWDMTSLVTQDIQVVYDIHNLVNKDIQVDYDILNLISKDIQALWDITNLVYKDLQALWDMSGSVQGDLVLQWDILNTLTKDVQILYDILATANKDIVIPWDIRNLAARDLVLLWDMVGLVSKDIQALWDIDNLTSKDLEIQFDISELVSKDIELLYDLLNSVNKDIAVVYDIEAGSGTRYKDLTIVYDLGDVDEFRNLSDDIVLRSS